MSTFLLALVVGCDGLDRVPITVGYHCAPDREEVVGCVYDGDTFYLNSCEGESVRLLGVNAGELDESLPEEERCWGPEAAAWLTDLLLGQRVRLEFDETCTDAYERTLAYVWIESAEPDGDDLLVNEALLLAGQARVIEPPFDDIRLKEVMESAEFAAQRAGLGLWSACE